jgi:L-2-hydroxyglutarate oxidase LhgO
MDRSFDAIVIGAGVVGLACAAALARKGSVLVLERHPRVGLENSARNSGVIHAGLHHPAAFLKTRLCVRGRELLYRRCVAEGIPHRRTGKLIVAQSAEDEARLWGIARHADDLGIESHILDAAQVREAEPAIRAHAALEVPATGIVRSQALVRSLLDECESLGAVVLTGADVAAVEPAFRVRVNDVGLTSPRLVIAAGLASDRLAAHAGLDVDALGIRQRLVRGVWLALDERHRKAISRLVYPLPDAEGLGIHLTRDLDGFLLAGPDAEPIETPDFSLPSGREEVFAAAVARYFPAVSAADLHPCSVGVRTKLGAPGTLRDFALLGPESHGLAGLVVLAGIESPGLTACLAIAEEVVAGLAVYT